LAGVSRSSFKKNTVKTYQSILSKLTAQFGERDLISLPPEEVLSFLTRKMLVSGIVFLLRTGPYIKADCVRNLSIHVLIFSVKHRISHLLQFYEVRSFIKLNCLVNSIPPSPWVEVYHFPSLFVVQGSLQRRVDMSIKDETDFTVLSPNTLLVSRLRVYSPRCQALKLETSLDKFSPKSFPLSISQTSYPLQQNLLLTLKTKYQSLALIVGT